VLAGVSVAGDEPVELAGRLVGKASVIADADRVAAAEWARRKFGVTAFVLDDGFQHRRAKRDVDIVCIDATDAFRGGRVVPAGRLRERRTGLERADVVVITRGDMVDQIEDLKSEIAALNSGAPVFVASANIARVTSLEAFHSGAQSAPHSDSVPQAMAFCGVGNPESFFRLLRRENVDLLETQAFRDHHGYTQQDIAKIESVALRAGAEVLLTTAKDAVKLADLQFKMPCFVVEIEMGLDDPKGFAAMI
jgi:tetraacyldisaccharide 4'-kinase